MAATKIADRQLKTAPGGSSLPSITDDGSDINISPSNSVTVNGQNFVVNTSNGGSLRVDTSSRTVTMGDWGSSGNNTFISVVDVNYIIKATLPGSNSDNQSTTLWNDNGEVRIGTDIPKSYQKTFVFGINGITLGLRENTKIAVPYNCQIIRWKLTGISSNDISLDLLKNNLSIVGSNFPTLSGTFNESSTLTSWSTSLSENDILSISVNNKSNSSKVIFQLIVILT